MSDLITILSNDCYQIIANNLCYIDLMALIYCCSQHFHSINPGLLSARHHIQRYMNNHGLKYKNFLPRLSSECIIFGGFIFNTIMNVFDKDSDIDILHYRTLNELYRPIQKLEVNRGKYNTFPAIYDNCDANLEGTGYCHYPMTHIKDDGSSSDGIKYHHLTLLFVCDSFEMYLDKVCDMDITKSYYDHKTDRIRVKSLDKLWERRDEIDLRYSYNVRFAHFNWSKMWDMEEYYNNYRRCCERVEKYRRRGINIVSSHNYNEKEYLLYLENVYHLDFPHKKHKYVEKQNLLNKINDVIERYNLEFSELRFDVRDKVRNERIVNKILVEITSNYRTKSKTMGIGEYFRDFYHIIK